MREKEDQPKITIESRLEEVKSLLDEWWPEEPKGPTQITTVQEADRVNNEWGVVTTGIFESQSGTPNDSRKIGDEVYLVHKDGRVLQVGASDSRGKEGYLAIYDGGEFEKFDYWPEFPEEGPEISLKDVLSAPPIKSFQVVDGKLAEAK
jgi:hypothetical protein